MKYLSGEDWLVIGSYLVGIILFGTWIGRGQKNTRDYFLGSRSVPWWGVGLSIIATETSALTFIGVPAMAYGPDDLTFIQIIVGYVIARVLLAVVMVPHYFRGEIYSPYELFRRAFGPGARTTAAGFFLVGGVLAAGVRVYVTCIPIQLILGFQENQILWAIILFVLLSLVYTCIGGVKAVIWTDAVQFFLFMLGGIFTLCFIPTLAPGGIHQVMSAADAAGKLHWLNSGFSLGKPFNIWMGVIGATFMVMSTHGADQLIVQRVLTCKSVKDGRKALILSAVIIFPLFLIFLFTGIMLWVYYHVISAVPAALPEVRPGIGRNDYIFPLFILTHVPTVMKGFLIVAILSAAMSSTSSAMSALASVSMMDFFKGLSKRERSEEFYLRLSRYSTVFWAIMLVLIAVMTQHVESVLNAAFSLSGLTHGAMLGGLFLVVWWRKGSSTPVIAGMLGSLLLMTAIEVVQKVGAFSSLKAKLQLDIAWPWYTMLGTLLTVLIAIVVRGLSGEKRAPVEPVQ